MDPNIKTVEQITFFTSIAVFVMVSAIEFYVVSKRKFKMDASALITMSLYFVVMLVRFLRCFVSSNGNGIDVESDSPLQTGISLTCHTLISMSMYFFVFEMQSVKLFVEFAAHDHSTYIERKKSNLLQRNIVMGIAACYGISYTTIRTIHANNPEDNFEGFMKIAYIITFSIKLLLDFFAFTIFGIAFYYFLNRKRAALKREALIFTPLH